MVSLNLEACLFEPKVFDIYAIIVGYLQKCKQISTTGSLYLGASFRQRAE